MRATRPPLASTHLAPVRALVLVLVPGPVAALMLVPVRALAASGIDPSRAPYGSIPRARARAMRIELERQGYSYLILLLLLLA